MNDQSTSSSDKGPSSSTGSSSPVIVSTPASPVHSEPEDNAHMDDSGDAKKKVVSGNGKEDKSLPSPPPPNTLASGNPPPSPSPPPPATEGAEKEAKASSGAGKKGKTKLEKKVKRRVKKEKTSKKRKTLQEESSSSSSDESDDESSEDEKEVKKKKRAAAKRKASSKLKEKAKKKEKKKKKKGKKSIKYESSSPDSEVNESGSESDSESELDSGSESESESESQLDSESESELESESESSEDEKSRKKKKAKAKAKAKAKTKAKAKAKAKAKNKARAKKKASKKHDSSSSDSSSSLSSSDESSSSEDEKAKRKTNKKKAKKARVVEQPPPPESPIIFETTVFEPTSAEVAAKLADIQDQQEQNLAAAAQLKAQADALTSAAAAAEKKAQAKKKDNPVFKRVDQVWDSKDRDYVLKDSVEEKKDDSDSVFTVRRRFGGDDKYIETWVDIKSKLLRNALQVIFKDCKCISMVEDEPSIQPEMLYHFYKEIKTYIKQTLKPQLKRASKKHKDTKTISRQISQCKLILRYVDEDFAETRKTLKPMIKAGTITFDLIWALFKPNAITWVSTFGNRDDPRAFKVDECCKVENYYGKKTWEIEGRYLEYDGKVFGMASLFSTIREFKGHKKIANLDSYPLKLHKDAKKLRKELLERGKKFVSLQGMKYRFQKGLAYKYVKNSTMKYNINGRVMIDPALFRRINPNYPYCHVRQDDLDRGSDMDDDSDDDGFPSNDSDLDPNDNSPFGNAKPPKIQIVWWKDKSGQKFFIQVPIEDEGPAPPSQELEIVKDPNSDTLNHVFTEEELIIASPVVLGFSFSDKAWVEFSLSGITDIKWNDEAFDSLVLPDQIKQNLRGLVSSHRFDSARTIDDVIVGKGKGLNIVLHGPPGVGKTLTGESIAEYLRCPLYAVSSGELGTSAAYLERDLTRIMEITHSWGAILLLDEADVFLEARESHDINRNALVSVFLRLTEYYQGIMFLTTNRVSTFDEAFQSRIHMGIRYENLSTKARKKIWQHHVGKVLAMRGEGDDHRCKSFDEEQYDELSKKTMNGRQIKNLVKTSQAIAVAEKGVFGMDYLKRVMEDYQVFEDDMKGGRGYRDAMRQYT